jgi:SM-20-related protein
MNEAVFLKPPAHGRIANWLGPELLQRLFDFAQTRREDFYTSGVGHKESSRIDLNLRRSVTITDLGDLKKELRMRVRTALPAMLQQLGAQAFEPGRIEVQMVAHGDGAFFTEHCDTILEGDDSEEGRKFTLHRIISAVYYFHRLPKAFTGGVLRIYPLAGHKGSNEFIEIEPTNDTLVFFPSWFPHEVLPVSCPSGLFEDSRFAINFWVHREPAVTPPAPTRSHASAATPGN